MLQMKRTGWLTQVQKHKKIVLLLLGVLLTSCQQPAKQMETKKKEQTSNIDAVSKKVSNKVNEELVDKKQQEKQKNQKKQTKKETDEQHAGQNQESGGGLITYAGLPISNTLSHSPEQFINNMISENLMNEAVSNLTHNGIPVKYIKKNKAYRLAAAFDENLSLDPEKDSLYPGSVLVGSSIDDGTYREITQGKKRKAVYSFSLQGAKNKGGTAGVTTGEFEPNLAAFRNFHNEVLSQKIGYAASISSSYEEMEIKNEQAFDAQFKIGVGFSAAGLKAKIGSGFKFKSGDKKNRYLIRFTETFYTVDINQDDTPLMTDIPKEILGQYMPVYVSSVSYGRIAYLSIETDKTWQEIKPHLDTVLKFSPADVNVDVNTALEKLKEMTTTNIVIIGGGSEGATTLAQFRKYIVNGGFSSGNPGQIIKYKLRFLDDNTPAYIKYADSYNVIEETAVDPKRIELTAQVENLDPNVKDYGPQAEFFGSIDVCAYDDEEKTTDTKAAIFNYSRESALEIPSATLHALPESAKKTMILPRSTKTISLVFDIKERNHRAMGGDRPFFIRHDNSDINGKTSMFIKLPKQSLTETITLFDKDRPTDTIKFKIRFSVKYLFD